ncbi:alpha/beta hydrolase [Lactobacillaceae bacterium L1_55_11]|nr:alpha/beta hydrolase [Lactobacillaceae bacterium L1_55_11]
MKYKVVDTGVPIIFLHGFELDSRSLIPFVEPLFHNLTGYQRIYIDLPGMGASKGEDLENAEILVQQLVVLISSLVKDKFILVGQSYGGYLTLALLEHFEKQLAAAFLIAPMVIGNKQRRHVPAIRNEYVHPHDAKQYSDGFLDIDVIASQAKYKLYQDRIMGPLLDNQSPKLDRFSQSPNYTLRNGIRQKKYNVPITVLLGKCDNVVGYQDQQEIAKLNARTEFQLLQNSGHNLMIDETNRFLTLFSKFLRERQIN